MITDGMYESIREDLANKYITCGKLTGRFVLNNGAFALYIYHDNNIFEQNWKREHIKAFSEMINGVEVWRTKLINEYCYGLRLDLEDPEYFDKIDRVMNGLNVFNSELSD